MPRIKRLKDEPTTEPEKQGQDATRKRLFHVGSAFKPTYRHEIVGIDSVLGEIEELIHWLRHSAAYGAYQSRLQPGAIFSGSPGVGKTLVSRWIATESDALFVNIRDFLHDGALFTDFDIKELFRMARERYAVTKLPIVLFWDEFETAARERSEGGCTPEQRAVVSQLTAELDGIHGKNEGLLLVGCTNYSHMIDEALKRRGRMGVEITFTAPDRAGKEKILAYYLSQMTTCEDIDTHTLSYFFPRHNTAADIEEACVEAWRHAVRRAIDGTAPEPILGQEDLIKVFIKQLVGPPTTYTLPLDESLRIAIHESGHAIAALAFGVPLRLITVQPGKTSLGRVMVDDLQEYISTVEEEKNHMRVGLGGFAAEAVAGLEPMTGTARDISMVNSRANYLVMQLAAGMRTGLFNATSLDREVKYGDLNPQVSDKVVSNADDDVHEMLELVAQDARVALAQVGRENLLEIASRVNARITMTGVEFAEIYADVCGAEAPRVARVLEAA